MLNRARRKYSFGYPINYLNLLLFFNHPRNVAVLFDNYFIIEWHRTYFFPIWLTFVWQAAPARAGAHPCVPRVHSAAATQHVALRSLLLLRYISDHRVSARGWGAEWWRTCSGCTEPPYPSRFSNSVFYYLKGRSWKKKKCMLNKCIKSCCTQTLNTFANLNP